MAPMAEDDLGDTCAWCGARDVDLTCSRCMSVIYCGRQCQRAHWPGHKAQCGRKTAEPTPGPSAGEAERGAERAEARKEEEEQFRQHLQRLNKERLQAKRQQAAERQRQLLEQGFQQFMESLRCFILPRLPPCGPSDKVPVVVCGPAKAVHRRVEPAGLAFHQIYEREMESFRAPADKERNSRGRSQSRGKREAARSASRNSRSCSLPELRSKLHLHKVRLSSNLEGTELFTLLGLEMSPGYSPSLDDIKDAFRKLALTNHPDKLGTEDRGAMVLFQDAYEYLMDIDNKEIYESTLPFDDSIPSEEKIQKKGFFHTFGPVFHRNAKWSVDQPVPELGDVLTPAEEVREFYRFWYDFTSWRDVSPKFLKANEVELLDIYDCPRPERRERQKQNISIRKKFEVHERLRITKLVDLAWKHDPRLEEARRRGRKQKEEEQEAAEEEPEEEQITEEERKRREEEEAAAEEERRLEREVREEMRLTAKRQRARLRKVVEQMHLRVDPDEFKRLCAALSPQAMEELTAEVERLGSMPDSSGEGSEDSDDGELGRQAGPAVARRGKRKTPKQLAQEAIFEAMRGAGLEPTETRLSPEEAEALERAEAQAQELAMQRSRERAKKRREEEKEKRRQKQGEEEAIRKLEQELWEMNVEEKNDSRAREYPFEAPKAARRESQRREAEATRHQEEQRREQERCEQAEMAARRTAELESQLEPYFRAGDPVTVERLNRLMDFHRIGGAEAAFEVARAAISAAPELRELLESMEELRLLDKEDYADEVFALLAECALPFFELGVRPSRSTPELPDKAVRAKVKGARSKLRQMVLERSLLADEEPETRREPRAESKARPTADANEATARSTSRKASGRSRSRGARSASCSRRSASRRQR